MVNLSYKYAFSYEMEETTLTQHGRWQQQNITQANIKTLNVVCYVERKELCEGRGGAQLENMFVVSND